MMKPSRHTLALLIVVAALVIVAARHVSRPEPAVSPAGAVPTQTSTTRSVQPASASVPGFRDWPTTVEEIRNRVNPPALPTERGREVIELARPAVSLERRNGRHRDGLRLRPGGRTQVGGYPLMKSSAPWPMRHGRRLSLVAQLDLDALGNGAGIGLPTHGLLQFFLDLSEEGYLTSVDAAEFDPVVRWQANEHGLVVRRDGAADWGAAPIPMDFRDVITVPFWGETVFRSWPQKDRDAYVRALGEAGNIDQMGGWPFEFQFDPLVAIPLRDAGVDPERVLPDPFPINGSPAERLAYNRRWLDAATKLVDSAEWSVVLQLGTTPGDSMWADGGNVWFLARNSDLVNRRFDRMRGEMVSH